MDIVLLKTFIEVARVRHFGQAAERLCVTQSAVSARVKLLESILGADLFHRRRNDIQLTPAGHRLLRHAEMIVRSWARARHEVALEPHGGSSLAVGCQLDLWAIRVRDWAARLRAQRPELALQIDILPADALVQRLAADQLDLIVLFEPPRGDALELVQVATVPLLLVSDRSGLGAAEATEQGYMLVDWGTRFMTAHSDAFPDLPPAALSLSQGLMALDLLTRVGGSAYLPLPLVAEALAAGRLYRVSDAPVIERAVFAVHQTGAKDPALLAEVVRGLREEIP